MGLELDRPRLIIISGPTASGKSRAALQLALALIDKGKPAEIISADSAQVYRYMDIGTDKLGQEEWQGIPHHLIDVVNPDEHFDAELFREMAGKEIDRIHRTGGAAILVGGTGFWIHALLYGLFPAPPRSDQVRQELRRTAAEKGAEHLHKKLAAIDPESAQRIHPHDLFRLVRALEVFELTGHSLTQHFQDQQREKPYDALYLALNLDRHLLYQRIESRVDEMMGKVFLDEVKKLREMGYGPGLVSQKILGYHQLHRHLDGEWTLDRAVHELKAETRHYARRQTIWLRKEKQVIWVDGAIAEARIQAEAKKFLEL